MSEKLNQQQEKAAAHGEGPLLIVAGAGSGKTRTLTSRLARLLERGVPPEHVIAITFTNKAAEEMKSRIMNKELGIMDRGVSSPNSKFLIHNSTPPFIGTFHSLGARILREESRVMGRTSRYSIYDGDDALRALKIILKEADLETPSAVSLRSKIGAVKNELAQPEEALDSRTLRLFRAYETTLTKHNAFDFDDLIEKVVRLFEAHPDILTKYRDRFRYVLVDEFQDVNTAQYRLVQLLAAAHKNLSVVGDAAQSIYGFRGSDFRTFLNFDRDWPEAKVVVLDQNYRSTKTILAAAHEVIKHNVRQKQKNLWTENETGELIRVIAAEDNDEEAATIAEAIAVMTHNNHGHSSMAILYRTNAQSRAIEQELIMREIPYRIFGGVTFYARKEIKDIVAGLRLVLNPRDAVSAERIASALPARARHATLEALRKSDPALPPATLVQTFLKTSNYFEMLERRFDNAGERMENVKELIAYARAFSSLETFLERVSLLQSSDVPAKTLVARGHALTPVNLMTIHLAKGLEFDHLFLIGASEGLLPHQMSYGSKDELEEERRLMYVAMTRARKTLTLSFWGAESRFLYDIPGHLTEFVDLRRGPHGYHELHE